jgi:hypothetical protein
VIIKLDYEKAYDRMNTVFLMEILRGRGFGEVWCRWISMIVTGGSCVLQLMGKRVGPLKLVKV